MFDNLDKYKPLTKKEITAFKKVKEIKVYGICCKCGNRISLTWNDNMVLKGLFRSRFHKDFSEIWNDYVDDLTGMICMECIKKT